MEVHRLNGEITSEDLDVYLAVVRISRKRGGENPVVFTPSQVSSGWVFVRFTSPLPLTK